MSRVGKTTLVKSLPNVEYFDCELPSVRQALDEPEYFLKRMDKKTIILDEIHRLINLSEVLKKAADHFPHLKVIATGSSTLAAKSKFKDTLTDRKHELWLLPAIYSDMKSLPSLDVDKRMLRGGLLPFLLLFRTAEAAKSKLNRRSTALILSLSVFLEVLRQLIMKIEVIYLNTLYLGNYRRYFCEMKFTTGEISSVMK